MYDIYFRYFNYHVRPIALFNEFMWLLQGDYCFPLNGYQEFWIIGNYLARQGWWPIYKEFFVITLVENHDIPESGNEVRQTDFLITLRRIYGLIEKSPISPQVAL